MKNKIRNIPWILTVIYFTLGFMPYKLPQEKIQSQDEILIYSPECTECPDFYLKEGKLLIPEKYKSKLPENVFEITLEKDHKLNGLQWDLKKGNNEFIITGKVIGIDSSLANPKNQISARPIVEIESWHPTEFHFKFMELPYHWMCFYFYFGFVLIVLSIISLVWEIDKSGG